MCSVPASELDGVVDTLATDLLANSQGSLAAYKDLYRVVLEEGLDDAVAYEARTSFAIDDTEDRIAGLR